MVLFQNGVLSNLIVIFSFKRVFGGNMSTTTEETATDGDNSGQNKHFIN